jgi:hypothetical protein
MKNLYLLSITVLISVLANAQISSNGTGGGLWSSTSTWSGGVVPTTSDNVTIKNGDAVTINVAASANSLTVGQGASGILTFASAAAQTLTVQTDVIIATGGTFQSATTGTVTTHVLSLGGSLTNNGILDFSTNGNTAGAGIIFTGASNNTFGGTGGTTDIRTLTINKGTSNASILELNPVNFAVQNTTTDGVPMAFLTLSSGTLKVSGTFTLTGRIFPAAVYSIPTVAGFWLNNPNFTIAGQSGSSSVSGLFRITQGTYNVGTATGNSMAFNAGSNIIVEGGAINSTGRFSVAAAATAFTYNQSGGVITVCTIGNASTTLASFDLGASATSVVSMTGGTIVCQLASTAASGPRDYRNQAGSVGIGVVTGGSLRLGNAASGAAKAFSIAGVVPNLILDNSSAGHSAIFLAPSAFNNITRDITINTGNVLNCGNNVFLFSGSAITNNGTLTHNGASSRFITFNTNTNILYTGSGSVTVPMTSLELQNDLNFTISPASSNIVANRIIIFSGSFVNANKLTVGNGGTTSAAIQIGNTTTPLGAGTFDQQLTYNPGTGGINLTYLRTSVSRTTGFEIPATRSVTTMRYDDNDPTHTLTIAGGDLTLSSPAAALTLTNGRIITGANNLIINSGSATVTRTTGYVDGNFRKTFSVAASKTFEVGTASGYSPVTVNATAGTFPSDFTVNANQGTHAGLNSAISLQRYWTLTGTGLTADLSFNYIDPTDIPVTAIENNFVVFKYSAGTFTQPGGAINTAANIVTISGVSSFSDWTLAEPGAVLPINLLSFSGYKESDHIVLRWSTGSESNNRGFEILRSKDGINYNKIGFANSLAPGGNSNRVLNYIFRDNNPAGVKQYYRLRQVDIDNHSSYSNIVLIRGDKPLILAIGGLYPNPSSDVMNVIINSPARDNMRLLITDIAGKIVKQQAANVETGSNLIMMNINDLPNGTYTIKVVSNSDFESAVSNFIKQ